jgi:Delta7-sterol 5-desaturase
MATLATSFWDFLKITSQTTVGVGVRYAVLAGIAWLLGYVFFKRKWRHRKIIPRLPRSEEVWREIRYSAVTLVVFGLVGTVTFMAARAGWTQLYFQIGERGWVWFWVSIACAIALHDTYFYWTHRLMHHRRLFRLFHRAHHLSHNPSPWAAYAFSPLEAVVEAAIFPLAATVIPLHPLAFVVFMGWQIVFNVAGHTGYEFYPRWLIDSWLGRILNTPTNHIMHHESMRGNYGLYFNIWDRLMRTNHESYEQRFREVTSRERIIDPESADTSAAPARPNNLPA